MLRRARLFHEAHAAVDLHADGGHFAADICGEGLRDRRQQRHAIGGCGADGGIARAPRHVGFLGGHEADHARGLRTGLHGHDHAAHVGVLDDRRMSALGDRGLLPCLRSFA